MAADPKTTDDNRPLDQLISESKELRVKAKELMERLYELQQMIARRKRKQECDES